MFDGHHNATWQCLSFVPPTGRTSGQCRLLRCAIYWYFAKTRDALLLNVVVFPVKQCWSCGHRRTTAVLRALTPTQPCVVLNCYQPMTRHDMAVSPSELSSTQLLLCWQHSSPISTPLSTGGNGSTFSLHCARALEANRGLTFFFYQNGPQLHGSCFSVFLWNQIQAHYIQFQKNMKLLVQLFSLLSENWSFSFSN